MLLKKKNAVIYGAGGAVGGAVARAFAREGANVFLAGRRLKSIDTVAKEIAADGGVVEIAQVDAQEGNACHRGAAQDGLEAVSPLKLAEDEPCGAQNDSGRTPST